MRFGSTVRQWRVFGIGSLTLLCAAGGSIPVAAEEEAHADRLQEWSFLVGDWDLEERRFSFEGELIQENAGRATFSWTLSGTRIQELQELAHGDERTQALLIYVYNPRSDEIEIARTDSGHYGFSVTIGTIETDRLVLREKHPNPDHEVVRRYTYTREDADRFVRRLEFSTDGGATWFDRSLTTYTRH